MSPFRNINNIMKDKIFNIMFPIGGGTVGAITQLQSIARESHWALVWDTIIVSAVGATVGILVNELWKAIKRRNLEQKNK